MKSKFNRLNVIFKKQELQKELELRFLNCILIRCERRGKIYFYYEFLRKLCFQVAKTRKRLLRGSNIYYCKEFLKYIAYTKLRFRYINFQLLTIYSFYSFASQFDKFCFLKLIPNKRIWEITIKNISSFQHIYTQRNNFFFSYQEFLLGYPFSCYGLEEVDELQNLEQLQHSVNLYYRGIILFKIFSIIDFIEIIFYLEIMNNLNFWN